MSLVLAAKVWHYGLSFALLAPAVLTVVAVIVGYFVKVVSARYPKG